MGRGIHLRLANEGGREKLEHRRSNIFNLEGFEMSRTAVESCERDWGRRCALGGGGLKMEDSIPERGSSGKAGIESWNRNLVEARSHQLRVW